MVGEHQPVHGFGRPRRRPQLHADLQVANHRGGDGHASANLEGALVEPAVTVFSKDTHEIRDQGKNREEIQSKHTKKQAHLAQLRPELWKRKKPEEKRMPRRRPAQARVSGGEERNN
jgi:hypothetical protein